MAVRLADGSDRVGVVENERLVWRCGDANVGARRSGDGFVEPDLLDDGRVFYQAEERGPGRHQRSACLLLGQPVQAMVEIAAVLVEERLELGACWLADDVLGRRAGEEGHVCSIAGASQFLRTGPAALARTSLQRRARLSCACAWVTRPRPRTRTWPRDWARGCSSARRCRPRPSCPSRNWARLSWSGPAGCWLSCRLTARPRCLRFQRSSPPTWWPVFGLASCWPGSGGRGQPTSTRWPGRSRGVRAGRRARRPHRGARRQPAYLPTARPRPPPPPPSPPPTAPP